MTAAIHIYDTKRIKADANSNDGTHWVTNSYRDGLEEVEFRVTAFFDDFTTARAYADAINGVSAPALEAAE